MKDYKSERVTKRRLRPEPELKPGLGAAVPTTHTRAAAAPVALCHDRQEQHVSL